MSFRQYFEFRSSIVNILEYLSDVEMCTFPILPKVKKRKLNVRKKYFSIFIQFISQDICANALFVSNVGIIISYCCKMSFYSIVVSFLFPLQKYFFVNTECFKAISPSKVLNVCLCIEASE